VDEVRISPSATASTVRGLYSGDPDSMSSKNKSSAHAHTTTNPATRAGDPFVAAARRHVCSLCFGGYVTITVEEDGQEHDEAVPCRRCRVLGENL
jgi:hypothetical protein